MGFFSQLFDRTGKQKSVSGTLPPSAPVGGSDPAKTLVDRDGGKYLPSAQDAWPIKAELISGLRPICNLTLDQLLPFTGFGFTEAAGEGSMLFRKGRPSESLHFLLDGTVRMDMGGGEHFDVTAGSPRARFPLCGAGQYSASAYALSDLQVLRVSRAVLSYGYSLKADRLLNLDADTGPIPKLVSNLPLFREFCRQYREGKLSLPVLPDVAMKIGRAIDQGAGLKEVAAILELEPAIAAKVVATANSPMYFRGKRAESCPDAVSRLGLGAVRSLVTAFYAKQAFRGRNSYILGLMEMHWRSSVHISAICYALAAAGTAFDAEQALLGGLMCHIGAVPFLYFMEQQPKDSWQPADIDAILPNVRGPVGAYLLDKWGFPPDMVLIPAVADDWLFDRGPALSLADLVIIAKLHSFVGTAQMPKLPHINAIPAYSKLGDQQLTPRHSLKVLNDAREKIDAAMRLFDD